MIQGLADEAQCLFLRLFLRKGPWFRLDTLSYSELTHIPTAASQLCRADFATPIHPVTGPAASLSLTHLIPMDTHTDQTGDLQSGVADCSGAGGCSLADASSCSGQSVCEVAEALTVAELQQLMAQMELGIQGRVTGIGKGQMLQLLKGGLEKAGASKAEVSCPWLSGRLLKWAACSALHIVTGWSNQHKVMFSMLHYMWFRSSIAQLTCHATAHVTAQPAWPVCVPYFSAQPSYRVVQYRFIKSAGELSSQPVQNVQLGTGFMQDPRSRAASLRTCPSLIRRFASSDGMADSHEVHRSAA